MYIYNSPWENANEGTNNTTGSVKIEFKTKNPVITSRVRLLKRISRYCKKYMIYVSIIKLIKYILITS